VSKKTGAASAKAAGNSDSPRPEATAPALDSTDIGRPRNGMFVVESGRLGIEIERESRRARRRTRAGY